MSLPSILLVLGWQMLATLSGFLYKSQSQGKHFTTWAISPAQILSSGQTSLIWRYKSVMFLLWIVFLIWNERSQVFSSFSQNLYSFVSLQFACSAWSCFLHVGIDLSLWQNNSIQACALLGFMIKWYGLCPSASNYEPLRLHLCIQPIYI
jgi:hypothetical protein